MDKVIVYFSKDGSTRILANELSKNLDADIIELVPLKEGNFISNTFRSLFKKGATLKGNPYSKAKKYSEIYLCTPIWALNGTPAIISFIDNTNLKDKDIHIFSVRGFNSSVKGTHKFLQNKVESKNGNVINCYDIKGAAIGKTATVESIKKQLSAYKL